LHFRQSLIGQVFVEALVFYTLMEKFTFHKYSTFCSLTNFTSLFLISRSKRFRIVNVADNTRRDVLLPLYHTTFQGRRGIRIRLVAESWTRSSCFYITAKMYAGKSFVDKWNPQENDLKCLVLLLYFITGFAHFYGKPRWEGACESQKTVSRCYERAPFLFRSLTLIIHIKTTKHDREGSLTNCLILTSRHVKRWR